MLLAVAALAEHLKVVQFIVGVVAVTVMHFLDTIGLATLGAHAEVNELPIDALVDVLSMLEIRVGIPCVIDAGVVAKGL